MSSKNSISIKSEDSIEEIEENDAEKIKIEEQIDEDFYPWIKPDSVCHKLHGMLKLHYEILDFYDFIQLNKEEKELREKTFNDIKNIIEKNFKEYICKIYGSYKTGLSLPDSDIDILILPKDEKNTDNIKSDILNKKLKEIYDILSMKDLFSQLELIKAKVPIIRCIYKETNVQIDISLFRKDGVLAVETIEKINKVYPEIKPLMLLIKYALKQRQLNKIYKGGVSSFIIFSLIFYYLSDYKKKSIERKESNKIITLGHLLLGFLSFYGYEFRYDKYKISIRNGCFLSERYDDNKNVLSLENFQDGQDIGKSCYKYRNVIDVFKFARKSLYFPDVPVVSYLKGFIFPDDTLRERAQNYK
jgi:non-canonical poly(A) RNA polymerase PAPD5/7